MYRAGLILAGLAAGMVTFGGSALAVSPNVTAESVQSPIDLPDPFQAQDTTRALNFGERNNFGVDNDLVQLDALEVLSRLGVLSHLLGN
jgi:hypothetical protein